MFVGVDGCSDGWVCVVIGAGGWLHARVFASFDTLVAAYPDAAVIGVDMPIGLTAASGRATDRAARARLPGAASSVFNAPCRDVLSATSYEEAQRRSTQVTGKGLSRQSYALLGKIREVDRHAADPRVVEVHPEVSFRVMSGGTPLGRKKSWGGVQARLAWLAREGIELPASIGEADRVGTDDVVDAAAAAWSARRVAHGIATRIAGEAPEHDVVTGRLVAIWA